MDVGLRAIDQRVLCANERRLDVVAARLRYAPLSTRMALPPRAYQFCAGSSITWKKHALVVT